MSELITVVTDTDEDNGRVEFQILAQHQDLYGVSWYCEETGWWLRSASHPEVDLGDECFYIRGNSESRNDQTVECDLDDFNDFMATVECWAKLFLCPSKLEEEYFAREGPDDPEDVSKIEASNWVMRG